MQYKVIWLNEAIHELQTIRFYIEEIKKAPAAAQKLVEKIYNIAGELTDFPAARGHIDQFKPKFRNLVVAKNYSILYQVEESKKVVYVAHIWHNAQDKSTL